MNPTNPDDPSSTDPTSPTAVRIRLAWQRRDIAAAPRPLPSHRTTDPSSQVEAEPNMLEAA